VHGKTFGIQDGIRFGETMDNNSKIARLAGLLYLVYIAASIVADLFGHFVFANAEQTIQLMQTHETQFRIGFVISLFSVGIFFLAAWALYRLLKGVNADMALLLAVLNGLGMVVWLISLLSLFGGLLVLRAGEASGYTPAQLQSLATVLIDLRRSGAVIAQLPYSLWLFPLGYLVYRSGFLPKFLGGLLIADGVGLLIYILQRFLAPELSVVAYPCYVLGFVAECGLAVWLVVKGAPQPKRAPDGAVAMAL
jgi:hypothetical protein